jgi:hypothetical protein
VKFGHFGGVTVVGGTHPNSPCNAINGHFRP